MMLVELIRNFYFFLFTLIKMEGCDFGKIKIYFKKEHGSTHFTAVKTSVCEEEIVSVSMSIAYQPHTDIAYLKNTERREREGKMKEKKLLNN